LTNLDLDQNELTGEIPTCIGASLVKLKTLKLGSNLFAGVIPVEICNLVKLDELKLDDNELDGKPQPFNAKVRYLNVLGLSSSYGILTYLATN
jgi:hypothetical protein